uniref:DNA/RNA-binding domain-containing protein n=1 Tax=Bionectria ochroleuca TaxID=29856 RepID=A0A0B7KKM5_BIOOC
MAGRLWKHGIHSFLEILRTRQPGSHEHMLTFIHQAYTLLELLYESVPILEVIWLNFLGDVSRYGMFVDENSDDGNIWIGVSRQWYSLASEKSPSAGHLYHHLAILARADVIQKLYLPL